MNFIWEEKENQAEKIKPVLDWKKEHRYDYSSYIYRFQSKLILKPNTILFPPNWFQLVILITSSVEYREPSEVFYTFGEVVYWCTHFPKPSNINPLNINIYVLYELITVCLKEHQPKHL